MRLIIVPKTIENYLNGIINGSKIILARQKLEK